MPKGCRHLTCADRRQTRALPASGLSRTTVARRLGRDPSTVSREPTRNAGGRGCRQDRADRKAKERRRKAS